MTVSRVLASLALVCALAVAPAFADDISDAIDEARRAYQANDLNAAKSALDVASQLIAQRNASGLAQYLPPAPNGWQAGEAETDASTAAMFGGGVIAKRRYSMGGRDITVQLLANSPLFLQLAPMFSNAQLLGAMGRVFRVKGKTALLGRDGNIQMIVGKALIMIEGSGTETEKRSFLEALDIAAIERFGG
ncbi:hypothetical protein E8L99_10420 [Phreatobacter aquaticus]|uniref:Uncharacterized protein n=1 Tax=Phreatobacter aquaticus TaxID=2570229 RepID=A0A4D7QGW0_9HYPH|nr:hypothetical protein [Phreatobacter aquaticus]QCK86135.1 hypothetical protein E8L99_10420 [Phreatobacter aquaticus]